VAAVAAAREVVGEVVAVKAAGRDEVTRVEAGPVAATGVGGAMVAMRGSGSVAVALGVAEAPEKDWAAWLVRVVA